MKRMWNKLRRGEKGQALIIALILMLVGGLIIAPVLAYVGSGLWTGKVVYEERMGELYAADAGVEDGLWYLQDIGRLKQLIRDHTSSDPMDPDYYEPPNGWEDWTLADYDWATRDIDYEIADDINGKGVAVTIDYLADDKAFKITSVATSDDSSTTIDAYLELVDLSFFLDNAITSQGNVQIGNNSEVKGDIQCPDGQLDLAPGAIWDEETWEHDATPIESWPPGGQLAPFYLEDVDDLVPPYDDFPNPTIDVKDYPVIPALYREGYLEILSSGTNVTVELDGTNGTVYIKGDLEIGQTNRNFTLDLNGQTIFVEGNITGGGKLNITGSGCIIAVGDIDFQPHVSSQKGDFILLMSIEGWVNFQPQPGGQFYGSLVGDVNINLQPNCYLEWVDPTDKDLNFPWEGYTGGKLLIQIDSWEISLQ
jgi:cytoskeletal protein CcmA (bactofilin family)